MTTTTGTGSAGVYAALPGLGTPSGYWCSWPVRRRSQFGRSLLRRLHRDSPFGRGPAPRCHRWQLFVFVLVAGSCRKSGGGCLVEWLRDVGRVVAYDFGGDGNYEFWQRADTAFLADLNRLIAETSDDGLRKEIQSHNWPQGGTLCPQLPATDEVWSAAQPRLDGPLVQGRNGRARTCLRRANGSPDMAGREFARSHASPKGRPRHCGAGAVMGHGRRFATPRRTLRLRATHPDDAPMTHRGTKRAYP
jgi:hypothetical protein